MAGRVEAQAYAMVLQRLAVGQGLQGHIAADARAQDALAVAARQVMAHAPARVVAVGMGDDGALDRAPGVDEEITGRAIQAFGTGDDEVHGDSWHEGLLSWSPPGRCEFAGRLARGVVARGEISPAA